MKKALKLAFILSAGLFLGSCTEKGPYIHVGSFNDTTYMATAETPQSRNILIEEFTGVTCPNCPRGHKAVKAIDSIYPGTVAISYYSFNQPQADPTSITKQDFRTADATNMDNQVLHPTQLPQGAVNRIAMEDPSSWATEANSVTSLPTNANITLTSNFDTVARNLKLKVRVAFTGKYTNPVFLTAGITESKIIDAQEDQLLTDTFYIHNHVLHALLTSSPGGDALLSSLSTIESGRVYERTFTYALPAKASVWNTHNCRVFAFVHTQTSPVQILQATDTTLIAH